MCDYFRRMKFVAKCVFSSHFVNFENQNLELQLTSEGIQFTIKAPKSPSNKRKHDADDQMALQISWQNVLGVSKASQTASMFMNLSSEMLRLVQNSREPEKDFVLFTCVPKKWLEHEFDRTNSCKRQCTTSPQAATASSGSKIAAATTTTTTTTTTTITTVAKGIKPTERVLLNFMFRLPPNVNSKALEEFLTSVKRLADPRHANGQNVTLKPSKKPTKRVSTKLSFFLFKSCF